MKFEEIFYDSETLLRGILDREDFWNYDENRPSSAVFKDSKGISVNRTGEYKKYYKESLENLTNALGNKIQAVAEINVEYCKNLNLFLKYAPTNENIFHSEIHRTKDTALLTRSDATKLAETCKVLD